MAKPDIVILKPKEVEQVKAENGPSGAREAFRLLETGLSSLKGRKFYGVYYTSRNEYFASVEIAPNNSKEMGLQKSIIPGGLYARRKIFNWAEVIESIGNKFDELEEDSRENGYVFDSLRPSIEFYRSSSELIIYVPVRDKKAGKS